MRKLYKYQLVFEHDYIAEVRMPWGATILDVQMQNNKPMLWALVDLSRPERTYKFKLVMTGQEIQDTEDIVHLKTIQDQLTGLVLHIFWLKYE